MQLRHRAVHVKYSEYYTTVYTPINIEAVYII